MSQTTIHAVTAIFTIMIIVSSETLMQNVMGQRVVLPEQGQVSSGTPMQNGRGQRVVLPEQQQASTGSLPNAAGRVVQLPQQDVSGQPQKQEPQPTQQQQMQPQQEEFQPEQDLQPKQELQPQKLQQRPQWQQQLKTPCCSYLRYEPSCFNKCKNKQFFNRGFLDSKNYCRCYNNKDVFYYADLVYNFPRTTEPLCTIQLNQSCNYTCRNQRKGQQGYCFEKDICQCRSISRDNLNFFQDTWWE